LLERPSLYSATLAMTNSFTTESLPLKAEMSKLKNARVKSKSNDELDLIAKTHNMGDVSAPLDCSRNEGWEKPL